MYCGIVDVKPATIVPRLLVLIIILLVGSTTDEQVDAFRFSCINIQQRPNHLQHQEQQQIRLTPQYHSTLRLLLVTTSSFEGNVKTTNHHRKTTFFRIFAVSDSSISSDEGRRYDYNRKKNKQWLIDRFNFPKKRLDEQSHRNGFLTLENSILEGRANWLQAILGLNNKEMNKIYQRHPQMLTYKPETNLEPTLECLQAALKLDNKRALKTIILKQPGVLSSKKEDIEPKLNYLKTRLNLDETQLRKMIETNPAILAMSLKGNIQAKVRFLQQRFHLSDEQLSTIIRKHPRLFGYSIDNMESVFIWLQQRLSTSNSSVVDMVESQPVLLGCKVSSNLEPTFIFLADALDNETLAVAMISKNPRLLLSGLKRLNFRLDEAKNAGLTIDSGCLTRMAQLKDSDWAKSVEYQAKRLNNNASEDDLLW